MTFVFIVVPNDQNRPKQQKIDAPNAAKTRPLTCAIFKFFRKLIPFRRLQPLCS